MIHRMFSHNKELIQSKLSAVIRQRNPAFKLLQSAKVFRFPLSKLSIYHINTAFHFQSSIIRLGKIELLQYMIKLQMQNQKGVSGRNEFSQDNMHTHIHTPLPRRAVVGRDFPFVCYTCWICKSSTKSMLFHWELPAINCKQPELGDTANSEKKNQLGF